MINLFITKNEIMEEKGGRRLRRKKYLKDLLEKFIEENGIYTGQKYINLNLSCRYIGTFQKISREQSVNVKRLRAHQKGLEFWIHKLKKTIINLQTIAEIFIFILERILKMERG
ncbi:unnamed protein product (macronuclear) [Paramecium tetraurelia]|uniref:Uncharacterized protein n=1 Tax=Paramecium tetraurelia TaxID=5888 RepID=A0DHN5_PARTE|nr:uncharacterized protein GSPATT00016939001 [Paramecium tetraurelia]CAK82552.1 unnamed protein product [Paramecium tetraurelia]|eukprot:XP_001449949.1 hypothetical protein (macronuclear) [Paramecium tetraurelia strain d4-2]